LPIHAAIVFKAPVDVVEALLTSYPKSAEEKDDQGMLPLHLAFRNGATEEIVNLLLMAFPASVDNPDRKGRVPLTLAKNVDSPLREVYIEALEKGASHYSVAALALARERIVAEQKVIFDTQLKESLNINENAFSEMEAKVEEKQKEVEEAVAEKEKELAKLHENSQVLVDHVASLEAQLGCRSDTERFLATKIAKLEEKVRESEKQIKEKDAAFETATTEATDKVQSVEDLAESADSNIKFSREMKEFEEQKATLQATIVLLKRRLSNVTTTMESTRQQQMTILDDAIAQEEMMAKCMESHSEIVFESLAQEKATHAMKEEMLGMIEMMIDTADENRIKHLKIASGHGQHLSSMNASRSSVLSCAQTVTTNVIGALEKDLDLASLEDDVKLEVQKVLAERRPRPEAFAKVGDVELRENVQETEEEEGVEAEFTEETPAPAAPEENAEVVISSPKNVLKIVTAPEAEAEEEETRSESATPEEVQVESRVTAE